MTKTESKWATRVRAWRTSGQAAARFAEGRGFEASTLRWWASRLGREVKEPPPAFGSRVRLVRVTRAPAASSEALVVSVGAARIEVRAGFDPELVRELVDALGAAQ